MIYGLQRDQTTCRPFFRNSFKMHENYTKSGVIVTGDIVYMFCQRDADEDLYALLASPSLHISPKSNIQDALWSKNIGEPLQALQPLVIRAASHRMSCSAVHPLPNGIPISDQCLIFLEAIKDDNTNLVLTPRPSSIRESGLMADAWRHAPVIFTSGSEKYGQTTSFTLNLQQERGFLVTGGLLGLSTCFGSLQLKPATDISSSKHLSRLTSGYFESNVSFMFKRFASLYRRNDDNACVFTPAREAVATPVHCALDGSDCRTLDGERVYWSSCECQKNHNPDDKS